MLKEGSCLWQSLAECKQKAERPFVLGVAKKAKVVKFYSSTVHPAMPPLPFEKCPSCRASNEAFSRFERARFSIIFQKEDPPFFVDELSGYCCGSCHDAFLDEECAQRFEQAQRFVEGFYKNQQFQELKNSLVLDNDNVLG